MGRLHIYRMDMKYVRDLAKIDSKVMSVSPQAHKSNRPFVGIIVVNNTQPYCVPLSSPKPKHAAMKNARDFTKVFDPRGRLIGVLNFNNMIPVNEGVVQRVRLRIDPKDDRETRAYKTLMTNQIDWCNMHAVEIISKANRLYRLVTESPEKCRSLAYRCCDFRRLEAVLARRAANP